MTDEWEFFPCAMGDDQAFIFFDDGFSRSDLSKVSRTLVKVRLSLKQPTPQELPTNEEFPFLEEIEDQLESAITNTGGVYVGRVTVAGQRHFHYYAPIDSDRAQSIVDHLSGESGYDLATTVKDDPELKGYFEGLFPSPQERQMIQDAKVVESLKEHGDTFTRIRRIDHWVYFEDAEARALFLSQIPSETYCVEHETEPEEEGEKFGLKIYHMGIPSLGEVSAHTLALFEKAEELGGEYDGWETSVEK